MIQKINKISALLIAGLVLSLYCGTAKEQVRQEPPPQTVAKAEPTKVEPQKVEKPVLTVNEKLVSELNQKLEKATMTGFANGKTTLSPKQEKNWLSKNLSLIKSVVESLKDQPETVKVEVAGHASSRLAPKAKYIVITREEAALKRAEYAVDLLRRNGVDTSRFVAISKSDRNPLPKIDPKDGRNRRVSFSVVAN